MPPTILSGQVLSDGTVEVLPGRKVKDVLKPIYQIDPKSTPFHRVITERGQVIPATSTEVEHLEDQHIPFWDQTNGTYTNVATTITVDNGDYHQAGDVIKNPATGETMLVTGVSTNDLTVTRSWGTTAAAAGADNQPLLRLGNVNEEGSGAPTAKHTQVTMPSNYTEIKRDSISLSRTLNQINLYGNRGGKAERARLRMKRGQEHARFWEETLMHGEKALSTSTGARRATAGGLDEWVTDNVLDLTSASGVLAEKVLINFIGDTVRYGVGGSTDMDRVMFAGRPIINQLQNMAQGKIRHNSEKSGKYGFPVMTFYTFYGDLDVVYHPLLEQGYSGTAYILQMSGVIIRPLQRTVLRLSIQNNDTDGYKDEYLTEQSYSFANPIAFGRIINAVETTS